MTGTLRFASLIKQSGKPYATTLWTEPKADKNFARAMRENRVLTVVSEDVGSKKDFGKIGYHQDHSATYLIFPKPLPENKAGRVVGLNYNELAEAPITDPVRPERDSKQADSRQKTKRAGPERAAKAEAPAAAEHEFHAVLQRQAIWEKPLTVTAKNQSEAEEKFRQAAEAVSFDLADAKIKNRLETLRAKRTR